MTVLEVVVLWRLLGVCEPFFLVPSRVSVLPHYAPAVLVHYVYGHSQDMKREDNLTQNLEHLEKEILNAEADTMVFGVVRQPTRTPSLSLSLCRSSSVPLSVKCFSVTPRAHELLAVDARCSACLSGVAWPSGGEPGRNGACPPSLLF